MESRVDERSRRADCHVPKGEKTDHHQRSQGDPPSPRERRRSHQRWEVGGPFRRRHRIRAPAAAREEDAPWKREYMCPRKGGCGLVVEKEKVAEKGRQLCRSSLRVRWLCYSSGGILSLERERERKK